MGMFVEPIPATLGEKKEPVLLLGALDGTRMLYAQADGRLYAEELSSFVTDWRYDPETKTWHDVDAPPALTDSGPLPMTDEIDDD